MSAPNRIGLVAGDSDLLEGRRLLVENTPNLKLVFTDSRGESALERLPETTLDVLLVDLRLNDMSGVQLIEELVKVFNAANLNVPYIVLSGAFSSRGVQLAALDAGADAYVAQDNGTLELLEHLAMNASRRDSVDYRVLLDQFDELGVQPGEATWMVPGMDDLSSTQSKVFEGLCRLRSDAEIASALGLTENYVSKTVRELIRMFGFSNRGQLMLSLFKGGRLEVA